LSLSQYRLEASIAKTAFEKWIESVEKNANLTKKGVRINLAMYVYPDGHGNLCFLKPDSGKLDTEGQPVNNVEEAVHAVRSIWEKAANLPK